MNTHRNELVDAISEMFAESVHLDHHQHRTFAGVAVDVVELSYTPMSQVGTDEPSVRAAVRQTAVIIEDENLDFPLIFLSPRMKGIAGYVFAALGAKPEVRFSDSPRFLDEYRLQAWNEPACRILFTSAMREFFAENSGWSVRGNGKRLVVFRHNQVCPGERLDAFVEQSLEILTLFRQGEAELDLRPEVHRDTRLDDMQASLDRTGGLAGAVLRHQLNAVAFGREELQAFLEQPTPRVAPKGMNRQVCGDSLSVIVLGIGLVVAGTVAAIMIANLASGSNQRLGVTIAAVIALIGIAILPFSIRHLIRKRRLLRAGIVATGKIRGVKQTDLVINSQRRYHVTLEYSHQGTTRSAKANIYSGIERARAFQASAEDVRILVDPQDPRHVVCVDILMTTG